MYRITVIFSWIFLILPYIGLSQTDSLTSLEDIAVDYAETYDLEPDEEEITAFIMRRKKININRLDPDDLSRIPFLSPQQVKNLVHYVTTYGEVYSLYELQAVEGFDSTIIQRLMPYLEIGAPPEWIRLSPGNLFRYGRHDVVFRYRQLLQPKAGYQGDDSVRMAHPDQYYLGCPQRYYFRYRYAFGDRVTIGFSGDKDAGEEFFRGSQPQGMDFYSGFLTIRNMGWLKQLTAGNFRVSFGQGLTLGSSSFGSSVSFGSFMRYLDGFRHSQSVCEYGTLQGVAFTVRTGRMEWSGFVSSRRRDATLLVPDSGETAPLVFSSFSETGYHRTPSELAKKNLIHENIYGGHASYRGRFFLIGVSGYWGAWSGKLQPNEEVYKRFSIRGDRFAAVGIDGRCRLSFAQLFGEFSISLHGGKAWLTGISAVPISGVDLLLIYRNYQPQFQNPLSTAISQNGSTSNERGLYLRLQVQVLPRTTLTGYIDLFRFPWFRYRVNGSSEGVETGILGHIRFSPAWSFSLRYYLKRGEINHPTNGKTFSLVEEKKNELKAQVDISVSPAVNLKSVVVVRNYRMNGQKPETGYLVSQELGYQGNNLVRAVHLKYILFDTRRYPVRIYAYEPDVLYSWSMPACYGQGIRGILLIRLKPLSWLEFWCWTGITKYTDRSDIGNGPDRISGSLLSEVKVQVRVRF